LKITKIIKTLLTEQNAKTVKGEAAGYLTGILYMAPHTTVKGINTCPWSTPECRAACLYTAGRGKFSNVQAARIRKTELWRDDKNKFFEILVKDIKRLQRKAERKGLKLAIRLNGTSDIPFENYKLGKLGLTIFEIFPRIQFYDYTKSTSRACKVMPKNYHVTLSYTGHNLDDVKQTMSDREYNLAVVFKSKLPKTFLGRKVIDGDKTDLRFLDGKDKIVGLIAKGDARKQNSIFVVNN
jgi:hypothetical protein